MIKGKHFSEILRKLGSEASKAAEELDGENGVSLLLQTADELAGEEFQPGFHSDALKARLEMELDLLARAKQRQGGQMRYFKGAPTYKELLACIWKSLQEEETDLAEIGESSGHSPFKESFSSLWSVTKNSREKSLSTQ